jgi:hypothetical protein
LHRFTMTLLWFPSRVIMDFGHLTVPKTIIPLLVLPQPVM